MTESVRILTLVAARTGRVRAPTHCKSDGCSTATHGAKERCSDHLFELPYVAQLAVELDAREREVLRVAEKGQRAIHPESPLLEDVRALIETYGAPSIERLVSCLLSEMGPLDDGDSVRFRAARFRVVCDYVAVLVRRRRARWIEGKRWQQVTLTNREARTA